MPIDGIKIVQAVMEGSRIRDAKGIIPTFGVYLSLFFVDYYNQLSFQFEKAWGNNPKKEAAGLLVQAAQECGYATFQGIRNSWEWEELVQPMIEKKEDQIYGFTAMAEAFGWGDLKVVEIVADEKLVIRVSDSYEATGYLKRYGLTDSGKCYMLQGVAAAFMDLLYGEDYPEGCFTFETDEISCRAKGDPFCEFVAKKRV
jgi:predicted hydrocarbon binding protein